MSEKRFTKIKFDGSRVSLFYEVSRKDGDPDEFTLCCADRPAPEFDQALQALRSDVVGICELPEADQNKITVRGVTLTWAHDIRGACITALKSLKTANAPLVINTPHLPSEDYGEGDGPVLAPATCARLDALLVQTERYLSGERAQASLFTAQAKQPVTIGVEFRPTV